MNFLASLSSAVISAGSAALAGGNGVPGLAAYTLGDRVSSYQGKSIWTLYDGIKKDDSTPVSVFGFDPSNNLMASYSSGPDRRNLVPLAKNALRKLRALRHPNILKFLDGAETDSTVWIVTEHVRPFVSDLNLPGGVADESKVYGLLHLATALSFLNKDGSSIHGNIRPEALFVTQGGEWKLGGMEVCTRMDEDGGALWNYTGMLPDSRSWASPEVRKGGYTALKDCDASSLDAYSLHLLLFILFNGPLPPALSASSDAPPALPAQRGQIPAPLFQVWRRLGNPNPAARLKTAAFLDLGLGSESTGGGWWPSNRLVKLSSALEGFALASESERASLVRELRTVEKQALPDEFLKYKVLPSLVKAFEFGGGGPQMLPLILGLAKDLSEKEYQNSVLQPLIRMFATPDRATRMALLEGLDKFADKLTTKDVVERVWPHLMTGFGDVVPIIREATVKSILLIAPKLNDRILNNDLLRLLAKTQTDPEPGIRTNTCILLGRLSRHLQPGTNRKVLVPAFARALRDPFVHARIAGLMALMATAEVYEKEDLAGKVIPAMSICLIDRERAVREQGYKAMDMFVRKCQEMTKDMPDIEPHEAAPGAGPSAAHQAASANQPGLATNAAGAAGALAGWAFASVSKKISPADLHAPIAERPASAASAAPPAVNGAHRPPGLEAASLQRTASTDTATTAASPAMPGGFGGGDNEDWGGDLMNVEADEGDYGDFESGAPPPAKVDPFAARLSSTRPKAGSPRRGGALKLGAPTRSSALRVPMDMDATDSWDLDEAPAKPLGLLKPKLGRPAAAAPIVRAAAPVAAPAVPVVQPKPRPTPLVAQPAPPPVSPAPIQAPPPPASNPWAASEPSPTTSNAPASFPSPAVGTSPPLSSRPPTPPAPVEQPWGAHAPTPVALHPVEAAKASEPVVSPPPTAPASPAIPASRSASPAVAGVPLTAEEKAAKMAQAREERRARMAALKAKK